MCLLVYCQCSFDFNIGIIFNLTIWNFKGQPTLKDPCDRFLIFYLHLNLHIYSVIRIGYWTHFVCIIVKIQKNRWITLTVYVLFARCKHSSNLSGNLLDTLICYSKEAEGLFCKIILYVMWGAIDIRGPFLFSLQRISLAYLCFTNQAASILPRSLSYLGGRGPISWRRHSQL